MLKTFSLLCFLTFSSLALWAQSMDSLFIKAPQKVVPLLRHNARLDLLDYYHSHLEAKVQNDLNGKTLLTHLSATSCILQIADSVTVEIRRLSTKGDSILSVVRTVKSEGTTGRIEFYDTHWQPKKIELPALHYHQLIDIEKVPLGARGRLSQAATVLLYHFRWKDSAEELVLTPSSQALPPHLQREIAPYLRSISWHWNKGDWEE